MVAKLVEGNQMFGKGLRLVNFLKPIHFFLEKPEKFWLFVTDIHQTRYIGQPSWDRSIYRLSTNRSSYSPPYRQRGLRLSRTTITRCLPSVGEISVLVVGLFQKKKRKKEGKEKRKERKKEGRGKGGLLGICLWIRNWKIVENWPKICRFRRFPLPVLSSPDALPAPLLDSSSAVLCSYHCILRMDRVWEQITNPTSRIGRKQGVPLMQKCSRAGVAPSTPPWTCPPPRRP